MQNINILTPIVCQKYFTWNVTMKSLLNFQWEKNEWVLCLGRNFLFSGSRIWSCIRTTWRACWYPFPRFLTLLVWGETPNLHFYLKFPSDGDAAGLGPTLSILTRSFWVLTFTSTIKGRSGSLWFLISVEVYICDRRRFTSSLCRVQLNRKLDKKPESHLKPGAASKPSLSW